MLPELYHAHHSLHMEDLPFWLEMAAQVGAPILELGCGTGRLLIPLVQTGYKCVGLDHDLGMLRFLHARVSQSLQPKPDIFTADVSHFNLAEQFPLIIFPCNTFSTLDAQQRKVCLGCVRRHLKPGGTFAVSLPNPELLSCLPIESGVELEDEFILPQTGNPVQVSSSWHRSSHIFTITWVYDLMFPDGTVKRRTADVTHQIITIQEYLDEFHLAGLRVLSLYGDFDRSAYIVESTSLIIVASI